MLRIGLTGGIGSGKSIVCAIFRKLGVPVIDTDLIARDLVEPGTQALQQIVELFGTQLLQENGQLDRARLRELVFHDQTRLQQLEQLLHPLIRQEMTRRMEELNTPYAILAIPLLLEKGWQHSLDRVLVVDCSESLQRERALGRDGGSRQTIDQIIARQVSREQRLAAADDIIDNSGSLDALNRQVESLHRHYLSIAGNN